MATYFGEITPGTDGYDSNDAIWTRNKNKTYSCPGSGNQNLVELSGYVKKTSSGAGHIRLALYDTSNNLLYQGSAEVLVNNASAAWVGHAGITGVTLMGGINYRIAITFDSADPQIAYNFETSGNITYGFTDYTGGWPNPLADSSDGTYVCSVRAGVDPAAGGLSIPIVMADYRQRRN